MKAWTVDGPRLLILDNFEDVTQVNEVLARFQHPSLRILVTSRRGDFPRSSGLRVQKLGVFSEDESADFLEKTLGARKHREPGGSWQTNWAACRWRSKWQPVISTSQEGDRRIS